MYRVNRQIFRKGESVEEREIRLAKKRNYEQKSQKETRKFSWQLLRKMLFPFKKSLLGAGERDQDAHTRAA